MSLRHIPAVIDGLVVVFYYHLFRAILQILCLYLKNIVKIVNFTKQIEIGISILMNPVIYFQSKGRLRKKGTNLGHCPKFGYPLPPLNLGHP